MCTRCACWRSACWRPAHALHVALPLRSWPLPASRQILPPALATAPGAAAPQRPRHSRPASPHPRPQVALCLAQLRSAREICLERVAGGDATLDALPGGEGGAGAPLDCRQLAEDLQVCISVVKAFESEVSAGPAGAWGWGWRLAAGGGGWGLAAGGWGLGLGGWGLGRCSWAAPWRTAGCSCCSHCPAPAHSTTATAATTATTATIAPPPPPLAQIASLTIDRNNGYTAPGERLLELLAAAGLTQQTAELFMQRMGTAAALLADKEMEGGKRMSGRQSNLNAGWAALQGGRVGGRGREGAALVLQALQATPWRPAAKGRRCTASGPCRRRPRHLTLPPAPPHVTTTTTTSHHHHHHHHLPPPTSHHPPPTTSHHPPPSSHHPPAASPLCWRRCRWPSARSSPCSKAGRQL
jgi:hypothetical protein